MKNKWKILILIISVLFVFVSVGCDSNYTVEFRDENNELLQSFTVSRGSDITPPSAPEKDGYDFSGWDHSYNNIKKNAVLKPTYSPKEYVISFNSNGGSSISPLNVTYGTTLQTLPTPTKEGFEFVGWLYNNEFINAPYTYQLTDNITLNASWKIPSDPDYDEFSKLLKEVEGWIENSSSYKVSQDCDYNYDFGFQKTSATLLMVQKKDFLNDYYESYTRSNDYLVEHSLIKKIDDNFYLFDIQNMNQVTTELIDVNDYELGRDIINFGYKSEMVYERIDANHFIITSPISNFSNEYLDFSELGLDKNELNKMIMEIDFQFDKANNTFTMSYGFKDFTIESQGMSFKMSMMLTMTINSYNNITPIDLTGYSFVAPNSIEDILYTTDIDNAINVSSSSNPQYFRLDFETAQYRLVTTRVNPGEITIYDLNGKVVNLGAFYNNSLFPNTSTFTITAGTYIVKVSRAYQSAGYVMRFLKLDYEDSFDFSNPIQLTTTQTGKIEGPYDFVIYNYHSDINGTLNLYCSNNGVNFYYYKSSVLTKANWPTSTNVSIPVTAGDNYIILYSIGSRNYEIRIDSVI